MILQAPYPAISTTTVLPNPQFGDSATPQHTIKYLQSMNGTPYSYVKSNARSKLQYNLTLSRAKALELRAFALAFNNSVIRITDHLGQVWAGKFSTNPFESEGVSRSSDPGGESQRVSLEFEATLLTSVTPPTC